MNSRAFVFACCVLVSVALVQAQSPGAKAKSDPITGSWTGELVMQNSPSATAIPISLELKFDGKTAVSGTVSGLPNPADVKVGTFDPKKKSLKLDLGKQGSKAVLLVLEGTVATDTATGSFSGDERGTFTISRKPVKRTP
jgi:hypothetical protein